MQKLGQHFLRNKKVVHAIIAALDLGKGDEVIEIGPGRGALTGPLAEACAECGASLTAIEKDERLAGALKSEIKEGSVMKGVNIIEGDALEEIPGMLARKKGVAKVKLAGNLPYYLTGKILRTIGEAPQTPDRCVFMVQYEVGERLVAQAPRMNRLAASVRYWTEPRMIAKVPKEDFLPPPKVESAVVLMEGRVGDREGAGVAAERYYGAVRALFAQPRKTVANNLSAAKKDLPKEKVSQNLEDTGILPGARPQDLSFEDIMAVAKAFF